MEDAADARFNVPYNGPYGEKATTASKPEGGYRTEREAANAKPRREGGTMDRNYEAPAADAWGKVLTDGYVTVSPGIVQKEFEIVLKDGEPLNEAMYGLITKAEQIPSAIPLFWREVGAVNGHPMVLVQGHPHRIARFHELWSYGQQPVGNGWIQWISQTGASSDEFQRVLWLTSAEGKSQLSPDVADRLKCHRVGCIRTESARWAIAYNVASLADHIPTEGYEVELLCQTCATPNCDAAIFIEEGK